MPTVRTIFQPDREIEMPADEAAVLRAQGLLLADEAPQQGAPVAATAPAVPSQSAVQINAPAKEESTDGGK